MIGENIKRVMKDKNFTSKEFSQQLGISETHLSYVLNDKRRPSLELLDKMATILNVSLSALTVEGDGAQIETLAASRTDGYDKPLTPDEIAAVDAFIEAYRKAKHKKD